jgi:hypothetical protein
MKIEHRPPACAIWLVAHLGDRYRRDALLGDLVEEYQRRRSKAWFWRQAAIVLLVGARSRLSRHLPTFRTLLTWWCFLALLAFGLKSPYVLIAALDPSFYLLIFHRRRRR